MKFRSVSKMGYFKKKRGILIKGEVYRARKGGPGSL
jgi:hypothetical protein